MRFSHASGDVIDGNRPRSCLNFKARFASSRASSSREIDALRRDRRLNLFQTVLAHGLGEDGVGLPERIDPVDQVDVEIAYVHGEPANAVDQRSIAALLTVALCATENGLFGLLGQIQRGDSVLAHRFLIFIVQLGVLVLD